MSSKEVLQYQPSHPLDEKETQFRKQLPPREKELHALASKMLGSSYFTGKTHGFTAWTRSAVGTTNPASQSPTTK